MIKRSLILVLLSLALLVGLLFSALGDNPARAVTGEEHFTERDGVAIQYFIDGPPQGELVVLQASFARSGSDFNELAIQLHSAGYQTLVMQARGIDGSALPSLDASLFDYADDLNAVLDAEQQTQPLTVVGHAFGNRIARAFASRYPSRVRSLVLLAAGDSGPPPEVRNDIIKIQLRHWPSQFRKEALQRAFFAPGNAVPEYWQSGWYPRAGLAQGRATATTEASDWIHGGKANMLVVQPAADAAAAHGADKLSALYPERVQVVALANAGHAILPEQPEAVAQLILQHLAQRR